MGGDTVVRRPTDLRLSRQGFVEFHRVQGGANGENYVRGMLAGMFFVRSAEEDALRVRRFNQGLRDVTRSGSVVPSHPRDYFIRCPDRPNRRESLRRSRPAT